VPDSQWACHSGSLLFPQDLLPMGIATADADENDRVVSSQSQELKDEEDLLHFDAQVNDMQPSIDREPSPIVAYETDSDHTVTRRSSVSILLRSPYMLRQSILTFAPYRLKLRSSLKTFISMSTSKSRHRKIASRVKMLTISTQCHKTLGGSSKRLAMGLAARLPRDPRRKSMILTNSQLEPPASQRRGQAYAAQKVTWMRHPSLLRDGMSLPRLQADWPLLRKRSATKLLF
jgi:hypothetical protein